MSESYGWSSGIDFLEAAMPDSLQLSFISSNWDWTDLPFVSMSFELISCEKTLLKEEQRVRFCFSKIRAWSRVTWSGVRKCFAMVSGMGGKTKVLFRLWRVTLLCRILLCQLLEVGWYQIWFSIIFAWAWSRWLTWPWSLSFLSCKYSTCFYNCNTSMSVSVSNCSAEVQSSFNVILNSTLLSSSSSLIYAGGCSRFASFSTIMSFIN